MKALWLKWAARIDALSLRERAMAGLAAVAAVIFIGWTVFIEPAGARERTLRREIAQQRAQLAGIDLEIAEKRAAAQADPDADLRRRLVALRTENERLRTGLRTTRGALVAPEQMSVLLQQMVRQHGKLKLVSLRTLPPAGTTDGNFSAADADGGTVPPATGLTTTAPGAGSGTDIGAGNGAGIDSGAASGEAGAPLLYRHGVRIVLHGGYADMVAYMAALERLPARVFWGQAALDATEHDKATLTLTVYTLSLNQTWIAL